MLLGCSRNHFWTLIRNENNGKMTMQCLAVSSENRYANRRQIEFVGAASVPVQLESGIPLNRWRIFKFARGTECQMPNYWSHRSTWIVCGLCLDSFWPRQRYMKDLCGSLRASRSKSKSPWTPVLETLTATTDRRSYFWWGLSNSHIGYNRIWKWSDVLVAKLPVFE